MKPADQIVLSLALLLLLNATVAARGEVEFSELDSVVPAELKDTNTPGAVIAIIRDDRVVYLKAFGVANIETNAPVQPEMLFRLGSTTKVFTAAAALTLAEAGKIQLDEPIGNRVKNLSPKLAQATLSQLLSHSAGMRDFAAPFISHDDDALATMVRAWKDDVFFAGPGEIYSYSSPGYWYSGFVIEEVGGKPYADAMSELVFKSVGMSRTTLRPFMALTYPMALGHNVEGNKPALIRPMFDNVAMWPAGSMFSNINDLSRFVIAFLNDGRVDGKQALSSTLVKQLALPRVAVPGEAESFYAYGLTGFKYQGLKFLMHGGFSRGYGSMIQMVPERKFAVIVLTNRSGETLRNTRSKAFELGLGLKSDEDEKPKTIPPLTETEMAQFVGSYSHAPTVWEVSIKQKQLFVKYEGTEYLLTPVGPRKFSFGKSNENELVFVPGKSGRIEFLFSELYAAKKNP